VAFDDAAFEPRAGYPATRAALVRLLAEQELTGTFKIRKVDLQREGFDPAAIRDPLFLRDETARAYVPLTPELQAAICSGARTL
jgi:fatty-acyl-CoA synthase